MNDPRTPHGEALQAHTQDLIERLRAELIERTRNGGVAPHEFITYQILLGRVVALDELVRFADSLGGAFQGLHSRVKDLARQVDKVTGPVL